MRSATTYSPSRDQPPFSSVAGQDRHDVLPPSPAAGVPPPRSRSRARCRRHGLRAPGDAGRQPPHRPPGAHGHPDPLPSRGRRDGPRHRPGPPGGRSPGQRQRFPDGRRRRLDRVRWRAASPTPTTKPRRGARRDCGDDLVEQFECATTAAGNTIFMAITRSRRRWAVRLSITRRGGWYAWGPISGDFERSLAAQAGSAVIQPRVDGETRRGRDMSASR